MTDATFYALLLALLAPVSPIMALVIIAKWKSRERAPEIHEHVSGEIL